MSVEILQKENKILRKKSADVPITDIGSAKLNKVIADLKEAMHSQPDAVAIAGPQVGVNLRLFVVSGKVFIKEEKKYTVGKETDSVPPDQVFINPIITKLSKTKKKLEEGCLSVRYLYGKVKRSTKASIEAYNEKGEKIVRGASGLLAQIFQHETDHLDGVLFIDKAVDLVDLPPEKRMPNKE